MYLAKKKINNKKHYVIRESYESDSVFKSRDLFQLGSDPSQYIKYPGGNSYYLDSVIEDTLDSAGVSYTYDDLEKVFWPFLPPRVKRVISGFQRQSNSKTENYQAKKHEKKWEAHLFDRRRQHYLKFGRINQENIGNMSPKLYLIFKYKSRDEIEQYFLSQQSLLKPHERAIYIFVIFDLQRFFIESFAKTIPAALSQTKLDEYFLKEVCRLNEDETFWHGMPKSKRLREYLVKYVIMYFDNDFPRQNPIQEYIRNFINSRRIYQPPRSVLIKMEEAAKLFGVSQQELKAMDRKTLTRAYRRLAMKHHPDQGGKCDTFLRLTEIYQGLLRKKR